MSTNNIYYVDMEQRFNDFRDDKIDMRALHNMVYDINNVALAVRQLSRSPGRMALGPDGTNYETLSNYSVMELAEIVKDRLLQKKMDYVRRTYIPKGNTGKMRPLGICSIWDKLVEKCIQLVVEPYCETKFVESSFGFREQVSQHNALARVKRYCAISPYALSVDLRDYFGTIDPNITYRELWHIGIRDKVILNYVFRFIKKGYFEDSCKVDDIGWRIKKLFYHTMNKRIKFTIEQSYKNSFHGGRYRSWGKSGYYCFETYPVIEIWWANWDSELICHKKCKVIRKNPYYYGDKKHKPGVSLEAIGYLVNTSQHIKNSRLAMFRISKYSSVKGISYLSGEFVPVTEYHCHHIKPVAKGGTHDFNNLCVLSRTEHTILHGSTPEQLYSMFPRKIRRIKALIDVL